MIKINNKLIKYIILVSCFSLNLNGTSYIPDDSPKSIKGFTKCVVYELIFEYESDFKPEKNLLDISLYNKDGKKYEHKRYCKWNGITRVEYESRWNPDDKAFSIYSWGKEALNFCSVDSIIKDYQEILHLTSNYKQIKDYGIPLIYSIRKADDTIFYNFDRNFKEILTLNNSSLVLKLINNNQEDLFTYLFSYSWINSEDYIIRFQYSSNKILEFILANNIDYKINFEYLWEFDSLNNLIKKYNKYDWGKNSVSLYDTCGKIIKVSRFRDTLLVYNATYKYEGDKLIELCEYDKNALYEKKPNYQILSTYKNGYLFKKEFIKREKIGGWKNPKDTLIKEIEIYQYLNGKIIEKLHQEYFQDSLKYIDKYYTLYKYDDSGNEIEMIQTHKKNEHYFYRETKYFDEFGNIIEQKFETNNEFRKLIYEYTR